MIRLGVDLGGTKIEIAALDSDGAELLRYRAPNPRSDYQSIIEAVCNLVRTAEKRLGSSHSLGVGIPGTVSTLTGLVKNANSTELIGHSIQTDLSDFLARPIRVANDANCFTLSEATNGSGAEYKTVFGVILGTGVGGGICVNGSLIGGAHGIAGEWGHNPLPSQSLYELETKRSCYCGRVSCIETWCSGPALSLDFQSQTGEIHTAKEIVFSGNTGDVHALAVMERYCDRLARALANVVNILDPDVIVLGGGLSNIASLYSELPSRISSYAFNPETPSVILKNKHGDSSGVHGAAWLWSEQEILQGLHRW